MLSLLRRNKTFFVVLTGLGLLLRAYFLHWHYLFEGDSLIYGELAKNWLLNGTYALTGNEGLVPVDIRMPGYPAFLAAVFRVVGVEHYAAVVRLQVVIDLVTCFLIAAGAQRLWSERAGKVAFALAALCPFTANYTATPLPETLAIFAAAAALLFALRGVQKMLAVPPWDVAHNFAITDWIVCGIGIALSIYLRPDGGVLLATIGFYLLWLAFRQHDAEFFWVGILLGIVSLLPLAPWTQRNWHVVHQFEPLSPFYAELPGEYVPKGFDRWTKTWAIDFISVMNVEWNISTTGGGEAVDVKDIPDRAFDTPQQRLRTQQILSQYNQELVLTPQMDRQFAQLASERIRAHPIAFYLGLPLARLADMWLRPRTEMLNLELNWWSWQDVPLESLTSAALALINAFYLIAALISLRRRSCGSAILWLFILFRSVLLATLSNPEPRYTLECFPALMMLAGAGLARKDTVHQGDAERSLKN